MAEMPKWTVALIAAAAVASTGCSTHREFRVAAVGSDGSFEIAGDEDSSGAAGAPSGRGSSAVVSSGNLLFGGGTPSTGVLGGTVIGTLGSTDQTVVQLTGGTTVLLDGIGGTFGDAVAIDLGAGRVVGGPGSLVGVGVLGTSGGARVAAGGTGAAVQVGGGTSASGSVSAGTTSAGTLLPRSSGTGSVTGTVTGTATGTLNGVVANPCC